AAGARAIAPSGSVLPFYLQRGGMLNLQSKRGCPFRCVYCTYPHIEGAAMRLIPAEEVAATALSLQDAGARYLFMTDSAFNGHIAHSLAVAAAFKEAGVRIPWGAFFAPIRMPSDYFSRMRAAGLTHVEFGTEALCDPVLQAYRKPFRVEDVFRAHRQAVAAGLHAAHYLLLGGPGETASSLEETLLNIDKLQRTVVFFFCGMRIYPHTALYRLALENDQIRPGQDLLEPVFYQSPEIDARAIIRRVQDGCRQHPNWVLGAGGEETEEVLLRLYRRGLTGPLWEFLIC
ncbi:MAG: radical SAM protein, partial [Desulfosarcina sp.]|nr:radical SAM protein [Desulfobacterales bacterium]